MVLVTDLEIFAVYLGANVTITYVWIWITPKSEGAATKFFSEIVQKFALYKIYAENLQNVAPFLGRVPLKTRHSTKVAIFEAPLYNLCKGMMSRVRCIFQRT